MSTIDDLEDSIIAKLKNDAGLKIAVEKFPSRVSRYKLQHPVGVVLVAYSGSKFNGFGSSQEIRQADIVLTFLLRDLREHERSYDNMELCLDTLRRFKPKGASGVMMAEREVFVGETEGVWQYDQPWSVNILIDAEKSAC